MSRSHATTASRPASSRSALTRTQRLLSGLTMLLVATLLLATPAMAAEWYASPTGVDTNDCASAMTACATIQAAIDKAGANDTVHVGSGAYAFVGTIKITTSGLKLVGENSPFASTSRPGFVSVSVDASVLSAAKAPVTGEPVLLRTGLIWIDGAQNVRVENLMLEVNHGQSNEGIVTTGDVTGLVLRANYLQIKATGGRSNAISLNMAAGNAGDQNSTGTDPGSVVSFVTVEGNVVQPTGTTVSSRAIVGDGVVGVFRNNQLAGTSQDVRLRYAGVSALGSTLEFDGNWTYGAGVWITSPNAGASFVFNGNHFYAPGAPDIPASPLNASGVADPDFTSLKLIGGSHPVTVQNNEFIGFANKYRGLWIQNWPGVVVQGNTFTPSATYNGISSAILIGNKEVWNGVPDPRQLQVSILRNTFNAGYVNANSRAIVFINDNDKSGSSSAGALLIGDGNSANANNFSSGLRWYIGLDEHTCNYGGSLSKGFNCSDTTPFFGPPAGSPKNSPLGEGINYTSGSNGNTQGRPFRFDVSALGNKVDGVLVDDMTQTQYDAIAAKIYDKARNSALGKVTYGAGPTDISLTVTAAVSNTNRTGAFQVLDGVTSNAGSAPAENVKMSLTIARVDGAPIVMDGNPLVDSAGDSLLMEFEDADCTVASGNPHDGWCIYRLTPAGGGTTLSATFPQISPGFPASTGDFHVYRQRANFRVPGAYKITQTVFGETTNTEFARTESILTVKQALAVSFIGNNPTEYNGGAQPLGFTVSPASNLADSDLAAKVSLTYAGSTDAPVNAGDYAVIAISGDGNYVIEPTATTSYVIDKLAGTLEWGTLNFPYDNTSHAVTARVVESGNLCSVTPANVGPAIGNYPVTATCSDINYAVAGGSSIASIGGGKHVRVVESGLFFTSVAEALDDPATPLGATIEVAPGISTTPIVLTKSVKLIGGRDFTPSRAGPNAITVGPIDPPLSIVDGGGTALNGITIAPGVVDAIVSGFEVRNFTNNCVYASGGNHGSQISDNVVHGCGVHGIAIAGGGGIDDVTISNNEVYATGLLAGNGRGIVVWDGVKRDITITNNYVHDLSGCCGIELQDGTATGVTVTENVVENVGDSGMSFIQLTSGSPTGTPNSIARNEISNTGRFGIEIKIPNGTGAASGDGAILVEDNIVVASSSATNPRDRAGIAVIRRALSADYPFEVDATSGVIVRRNNVSGFTNANAGYEGYGIVVEGLNSTVSSNTLADNGIGLQIQQGNPDSLPVGDANQDAISDWFGRGNAPITCVSLGEGVDANIFPPSNSIDQRSVPHGVQMVGLGVTNETTSVRYCSINAAIAAATAGDVISIAAGTYAEDVVIDKEITLKGAKAGINAGVGSTRDFASGETIIVPGAAEAGMSLGSTSKGVIEIESDNVVIDGVVIDGDNLLINSGVALNGSDPDVSTGIFASGNNIVIRNSVLRNLPFSGVRGYGSGSNSLGGNLIKDNRFSNITSPSTWGVAVLVSDNFYAQISGNLMDQVRVGVQTNNNYRAAPSGFAPSIADNEIHATRTGIFHNLFYSDASAWSITNNTIIASAHAAQVGQWNGLWVHSMQTAQTVLIASNTIDGSAIAGRTRVGYLLGNIVSSEAGNTAIDGGGVSNVEIGVLVTDATSYTGPVNDFIVRNVDFINIGLGALYVEDTTGDAGSAKLSIGGGNTYTNVTHRLTLAGATPTVGFTDGQIGSEEVFVRGAGNFILNASNTTAAAPIATGITAASVGGIVNVEAGTFAQDVIVDKSVSLRGPKTGIAGYDVARDGSGEAALVGSIAVRATDVVVDGISLTGTGALGVSQNGGDRFTLLNSRLIGFSADAVAVSGSVDWQIHDNLFRDVAGFAVRPHGGTNLRMIIDGNRFETVGAAVQLIQNDGSQVINNTVDGTVAYAVQIANSSNISMRGNVIRAADLGLLLDRNNADVVVTCNDIEGINYGIIAMNSVPSGTQTMTILHNRVVAPHHLRTAWGPGETFVVGSNFYDAATLVSSTPNGAELLIADPLSGSPIGNAACGNNAAFALVVHANSAPQGAEVGQAFPIDLQARVVDALGGAVAGESISLMAPASGASATLMNASGSSDHNGVLRSAATANGTAGAYNVVATSGSLTTNFALNNATGTATIALDAASLNVGYTGAAHAVTATTSPANLSYAVTYDGGAIAPTNAGTYTVVATVTDPNYTPGSITGTLTIAKATGSVTFDNLTLTYTGVAQTLTAHITEEPAAACTVTPATVGANVGSYPVSATCVGSNHDATGNGVAVIGQANAVVTLSHLTQQYDGSPKSVVATTSPSGLAVSVSYDGNATPPSAEGSYPVVATVTDGNYSGSATGSLSIVAGMSDIALVLNGPVDSIRVGDKAQYAATMLANPLLHSGETFGYKIVLSKSNSPNPLALSDLASMEVFLGTEWVDATQHFGSIPFSLEPDGTLVYVFPEGILTNGFPIDEASWTWNFRFSFADTGTYTTTAELVDGISHDPITPAVSATIATVVEAALPPTDMHLILGGPAGDVTLGSFAEYNGTLLADPTLHVGENFFVKVTVAKSGGTMTAADFTAMDIFLGGQWVDGGSLGVVFTDDGQGNLVYLFPESQMPGGFPINDPEWSWNFRFVYANTGVYTATAQVIPSYQAGLANPDVLASAAIATTVVEAPVVIADMNLLLIGPLDDVELGTPAQYTGTLLANPSVFSGREFFVRVRLSKNGGADAMTVADLAKMELYNGGWQDATLDLQGELQTDGNDLVYLFPQPYGAFEITSTVWSWNFRFTYASAGLYSAVADVIDAADTNPLTAVSLANDSVDTHVVPQSANVSIQLNGPVAGVEVDVPAAYIGRLTNHGPALTENAFVKVHITHDGGALVATDVTTEVWFNNAWVPGALSPDGIGGLEVDFPDSAGFPIGAGFDYTHQFRITYHKPGVFNATASLVGAVSTDVYAISAMYTQVVPQSANVSIQLNGPVAGVEVDVPAAYIGKLTNNGPALTENAFVKVHITHDGGALVATDVTTEVWFNNAWVLGALSPDGIGGLEVDFPDSAGFPIGTGFDYTHQFRITYHKPGVFNATATLVGAISTDVYATSAMYTEVVPRSAVTASVLIDPASLHFLYDGQPHAAVVSSTPVVQGINVTYDGYSTVPVNAGIYIVVATVVDPVYVGSASAILVIDKGSSTVTIEAADLHQSAGMTYAVGASANPMTAGASIAVTYNGSATVPTAVGNYTVVATLVDPNFSGSASAILVVGEGAQVSISIDSAPAMALIDANAPYTDLLEYTGSIGNTGAQTSQAVHFELEVVRIDDGNGSGGQPMAIDIDDVLACVYDPSGWSAQDPDHHYGCPQDYNSLFLSQSVGSLNGRPSTTFRYPNLAQNDQPLPTMDPAMPMPPVLFAFKHGQYQVHARVVGADGMVYATTMAGTTVPDVAIGYNGPTSGQVEDALLSQSTLTNVGGRVDGNVIVRVTLSDAANAALADTDATMYYQYGGSFIALPWTQASGKLVTYYGPGIGFPLEDGHNATTSAQGVFHREGSYNVLYEVVDIDTQAVVYASSEQGVTIGANLINFSVAGLNPVYTGAPLPVTVAPANVPHSVIYEPMVGGSCPATPTGGSATAPSDAGSYCVYVAATAPYSGSWSGTLVIAKATATISIDGAVGNEVDRGFNGAAQVVTATTDPTGLDYRMTYNGDSVAPSAAGSYALLASIDDANYSGIVTGTLIISAQGGASIVLDDVDLVDNNIHRSYSGSAVAAITATTTPANVSYTVSYIGDGSTVYPLTATPPTEVGQYHVVATTTDANYAQVSAAGTLVIEAQAASIVLDAATLSAVYNGSAHAVTATTTPAGIAYSVTYNGLLDAPVAAGSYIVVASITDANYAAASVTDTLVISAVNASIVLDAGTLNAVYDGSAHAVTATTTPAGLAYTVTYDGLLDAPVVAGSYAVVATITDPNHSGATVSGTLVISAVNASIVLDAGSLTATYDGNAHAVTATTTPAGLAYTVTYAGGSTPINAGSYAVEATITASGHTGSASGTLVIEKAAGEVLFGQTSFQFDGNSHGSSARIAQEPTNVGACTLLYAPAMPIEVSDSSTVTANCEGVNYSASASAPLQITAKPITLALVGTGSLPYTGTAYAATASVTGEVAGFPASVAIDYNPGGSNAPVAVGSYGVTATVLAGGNYSASPATGVISIGAANATVQLSDLSYVWDGSDKAATATTTPAGLAVTISYDGSATLPNAAGSYNVVASISEAGYNGFASGTLVIAKAQATVTLSDLQQAYDGAPKSATVTTSPVGLDVDVLYNGSATVPSAVGSYTVQVTVTDANHSGSASGTLHIGAGNAELLTVNGGASFNGIAGRPLPGALPSVKVTDVGGNPVAGVAITFVAGANSGVLSGAVQTTDGSGIATLGGWILDATPGINTLSASAAGVADAVAFTAEGAAGSGALSVTITDGRTFAKFGQALTYTMTVGNAGSANLSGIQVSNLLPAELDATGATWQCIAINGAICSNGSGDLVDTINLPAGSSVVYLLNTTALRGPSDRITSTITVTSGSGEISATDITDVVLFRNGFEMGGDGSQSVGAEVDGLGNLDGLTSIGVRMDMADLGSLNVVSVANAADGSFRVEAIVIDAKVWLRLVARAADGEQATAWAQLAGDYAMLGLEGSSLLLAGTDADLSIALERSGAFSLQQPLH